MHARNYSALKQQGISAGALYSIIRDDAVMLGGGPDDMAQRAAVYYHIYVHSGKNFIFPLIAAHGALWARWYLKAAQLAAYAFSVLDIASPLPWAERLRSYDEYVGRFKAINKDVMVETYVVFHFTKLFGAHRIMAERMPAGLLARIVKLHQAADTVDRPSAEDQRKLYEEYFRWEQTAVVGPSVKLAVDNFHWRLMKWFCVRPWVWFSYFRLGKGLIFKDFTSAEERIEKGLAAFDWASRKGWDRIEANLTANPLFPRKVPFGTRRASRETDMAAAE